MLRYMARNAATNTHAPVIVAVAREAESTTFGDLLGAGFM
jgi:hypothetical protein